MKRNLKSNLNMYVADILNRTVCEGPYELPNITCRVNNLRLDYLTLYGHPKDYLHPMDVGVCFYQYDNVIDGINGLYESIVHHNERRLEYFRKRFEDIKVMIEPDYTLCGDAPFIENLTRIYKARIVLLFMVLEWDKIVIPNISFVDDRTKEACFCGINKGSVVAISAKGCLADKAQMKLFEQIIDTTIDRVNPSIVVLYTVTKDSKFLKRMVERLEQSGSVVIIPDNMLLRRNSKKRKAYGQIC